MKKIYIGITICSGVFDEAFILLSLHAVVSKIVSAFRWRDLDIANDDGAVIVLADDLIEFVIPSVPKLFETEEGTYDWDNEEIWQEIREDKVP